MVTPGGVVADPEATLGMAIQDVRTRLAREEAKLRSVEDALAWIAAKCEQEILADQGEVKLNEDARKRLLAVELPLRASYAEARRIVRDKQEEVGILRAHLEGLRDARREREYRLQLRLAEAGAVLPVFDRDRQ